MDLETLTLISTSCIVLSGVSLLLGWGFIRRGRQVVRHRNSMLAATGFAGLFLVVYLTRWSLYGSKAFEGAGWWKAFYLANLIPHIVMAMLVGPLAVRLIYLALKNIAAKWKRPPKEWHAAKTQLAIQFGDRFTMAA